MSYPKFDFDPSFDSIHFVKPYIAISNIQALQDIKELDKLKVGLIINVCEFDHPKYTLDGFKNLEIKYIKRKMHDDEKQDLLVHARPLHRVIQKFRRKNPEKTIVVHCLAGVSRSVSVVIYHMMRNWRMGFGEARDLVKSKRDVADPNDGFVKQLRSVGDRYKRKFREPNKIGDHCIYIGGIESTWNSEWLKANNIKGIIQLESDRASYYQDKFEYLKINNLYDTEEDNISQYFQSTYEFIEKIKAVKGNVLIHCMMGASRSVAIAIAYLMKSERESYENCLSEIQQYQACAEPNSGFINQLKQFQQQMLIN